ncbi:DUF2911 domain-containing protein [Flavobacterium sp.]|uniref:DUF2911 domain-containing protein n=1 Tax=Flavobacterium sp. TaxID=239 RepID=UPI0038FD10F5
MYKIIVAIAIMIASYSIEAQVKLPQASPKSTLIQTVGLTDIDIEYHRPSAKGRVIFGELVPFDKVWRTGANENTTITFTDDVIINGSPLKQGKYAIYTIPKPDNWEVIFYSDSNNWGNPEVWDESKIVLKVNAKPETLDRNVETFTIGINNTDSNFANLEFSWEKTIVVVKIEVPTQKLTMSSIDKTLSGPSAADYYSSAQYFFQSNGDLNKALSYVNKAYELNDKKPYWYTRLKSQIQAKLGDKKGAIETAKVSLAAAQVAKNEDYIKMNQDSITDWSKK